GERFRDQPLVEAGIRKAIGEAFGALGERRQRVAHLERALELRRIQIGSDHPDTLACMQSLANGYYWVGRMADAIDLTEQLLEKRKGLLGLDDPATLDSLIQWPNTCRSAGQLERATSLGELALNRWKATQNPTHFKVARAMHNLALIHLDAD